MATTPRGDREHGDMHPARLQAGDLGQEFVGRDRARSLAKWRVVGPRDHAAEQRQAGNRIATCARLRVTPARLTVWFPQAVVKFRMFGENTAASVFSMHQGGPQRGDQKHQRGRLPLQQSVVELALDQRAGGGTDDDGHRQGEHERHALLGQVPGDVTAKGIDGAMGDVEHLGGRVDHREGDRDDAEGTAGDQAIDQKLQEQHGGGRFIRRPRLRRSSRRGPAAPA